MKKIFYVFETVFFALLALSAKGQSAITLDKTNITGQLQVTSHTHSASVIGVTAPVTGTNQTWDYSSLSDGIASSSNLMSASGFSSTSVLDTSTYENVVQSSPVKSGTVFDVDSIGYFIAGKILPVQHYSDALITGNPKDSTIWPLQTYHVRQNLINFPATMGSSWSSFTVHPLLSYINVTDFGITNAEVKIDVHTMVTDTVVGWGTLQIPSSYKGSIPYNVLLVREHTISSDSFYLNGQPAPSFLLSSFQSKQNDTSLNDYKESFYRAGTGKPLLTIDFGYDPTYSSPKTISYDEDNIMGGIETPALRNEDVKIFPNPVSNNPVNFQLVKSSPGIWKITLINSLGQIVKTTQIAGLGAKYFQMDISSCHSGLYIVNISDEKGNSLNQSRLNIIK